MDVCQTELAHSLGLITLYILAVIPTPRRTTCGKEHPHAAQLAAPRAPLQHGRT
jgi:hypothetical protein